MGAWLSKQSERLFRAVYVSQRELEHSPSGDIHSLHRTSKSSRRTKFTPVARHLSLTERGTQTSATGRWPSSDNTTDSSTQTHVLMSDSLTDFGDKDTSTGSIETFDHACDICDARETEAVAFCTQCEQYYCIACCRCHEKWAFSQAHKSIDKAMFEKVSNNNKLFDRQLIPTSIISLEQKKDQNYGFIRGCDVNCITITGTHGDVIALDHGGIYNQTIFRRIFRKDGRNVQMPLGCAGHMPIAQSGTQEVMISVPEKREIRKFSLDSDPLSPKSYFITSGDCWGIAEFDNGFAVSVKIETRYSFPDWQVQYLDSNGTLKKQIYYDSQCKPLFASPKYLASNYTRDILYVSDSGKQAIIALDVFGAVLYTFSHNDLKNPKALSVDEEDNVYVACGDKVIQIHKSGTKHRVLIQKTKQHKYYPEILSVASTL